MTNRTGKKSQRPFLYRSLASYLREVFGQTMRKVPIDPGFGCPNRDGTIGLGGCAFCNLESFVPANALGHEDPLKQIQNARRGRNSGIWLRAFSRNSKIRSASFSMIMVNGGFSDLLMDDRIKLPSPWRTSNNPMTSARFRASRMDCRLIPRSAAKSLSDGILSPGFNLPRLINETICL